MLNDIKMTIYKKYLFGCFMISLCLCSATLPAQQVAKSTFGTFALINASVETVTKGRLENATVIIKDGIIESVGSNSPVPSDAQVIDCKGLTIYPGLIDGGTRLGLQEIESISLTQDFDEQGELTPEMDALTAVNPNSVLIPVTRVSGVTSVITAPSGGLFPGTAALINLQGYTPEQMYGGFQRHSYEFSFHRKAWTLGPAF